MNGSCSVGMGPSPSLAAAGSSDRAYEVKYLVDSSTASVVEEWARQNLTPDLHGDGGVYRTATLYLDTAELDIYHKSKGYRRNRYRVRRYGTADLLHLERKRRHGDRVRKTREVIALDALTRLPDLTDEVAFAAAIRERFLQPSCWVGYTRSAFTDGAVRLTIDRDVAGVPLAAWTVPTRLDARPLLPDQAVLELKFRDAMPALFHDLLGRLPAQLPGGSKYGRCVEAWGLAGGRGRCPAG